MRRCAAAFALVILAAPFAARAQNTGAVPPPDIEPGERSVEYRAAYGLNDNGAPDAFAHRFHYQQSIADNWRARLIVQQGRRGDAPLKTQSVGLELFTQFVESKDTGGWASGLRFEGVIPVEDGRPGRARIGWLNAFDLGSGWRVRGDILIGRDIGANAADGFSIETRAEAACRLNGEMTIGAQMFNAYGTTGDFGPFNAQRHQVGPFLRMRLNKHVRLDASALVGVSAAAPDADFRVFASYSF